MLTYEIIKNASLSCKNLYLKLAEKDNICLKIRNKCDNEKLIIVINKILK